MQMLRFTLAPTRLIALSTTIALALVSTMAAAGVARAAGFRLDLTEPGDSNVFRDLDSGLEWLHLQQTWDLALTGVAPDLDLYLYPGSPWRYATADEICALLASHSAAPTPCPGEDDSGLALDDVRLAGGALGATFLSLTPVVQAGSIGVFPSGPETWGVVELLSLDEDDGDGAYPVARVLTNGSPSIPAFGHVLVRESDWPRLAASTRQPDTLPLDAPFYQGSHPYRVVDEGGRITEQGVTFRVWAPNTQVVAILDVETMGEEGLFTGPPESGWTAYLSCQETGELSECASGDCACPSGIWSGDVPGAWVGDRYRYLTHAGGSRSVITKRDPRALEAAGVLHPSQASVVYDRFEKRNPSPHVWSDHRFIAPRQREIVLVHARPEFLAPLGTLDDAIAELESLRELGANAIQLTPLMEFPSYDTPIAESLDPIWYNPYFVSDPMAIERSYGGPAAYKRFVDAAHARGLAVHHEVKLNFWASPRGHNLVRFDGWSSEAFEAGLYYWSVENSATPSYGPRRPNFASEGVRAYLSDIIFQWLDEFHVDGFRFDQAGLAFYESATGGLIPDGQIAYDWHREIHRRVHARSPRVVSIAENVARADLGPQGAGFDAQWWFGMLNTALDFPLSAAEISGVFGHAQHLSFEQATYFAEIYTDPVPMVVTLAEEVCPQPLPQPFVACHEAKRRLALLVALHLTAPGLPIIDTATFMLGDGPGRPTDLAPGQPWSSVEPGMWRLFKDLIHLRRDVQDLPASGWLAAGEDVPGYTSGLIGSGFASAAPGESDQVLVWHRWHQGGPGDDSVIIANLGETERTESISFPAGGVWALRLRTDRARYGYIALEHEAPFPARLTIPESAPVAELTLQPHTLVVLSQSCPDEDADGVCDAKDSCLRLSTRRVSDADADGYGDACDSDFDQDGMTGIADALALLDRVSHADPIFDSNGDGGVGLDDLGIVLGRIGEPPGPSGLACAGSAEWCTGP